MTFDELKFEPNNRGDVQARIDFANGYGASIIQGPTTYGGEDGLFELAVIREGHVCYDTPITGDVAGYLTPPKVTALLAQIEALPTDRWNEESY